MGNIAIYSQRKGFHLKNLIFSRTRRKVGHRVSYWTRSIVLVLDSSSGQEWNKNPREQTWFLTIISLQIIECISFPIKFETNRSRGSWLMIGHRNKRTKVHPYSIFFNEIVYKFFWGRGGGIVRKRRKDLHETLWLSEVISASGDEKLKNLLIFIRTLEAYYISPFSSDPHLCSRPLSPVIRTKDLANGEDGVRYPPFQFTDL